MLNMQGVSIHLPFSSRKIITNAGGRGKKVASKELNATLEPLATDHEGEKNRRKMGGISYYTVERQ